MPRGFWGSQQGEASPRGGHEPVRATRRRPCGGVALVALGQAPGAIGCPHPKHEAPTMAPRVLEPSTGGPKIHLSKHGGEAWGCPRPRGVADGTEQRSPTSPSPLWGVSHLAKGGFHPAWRGSLFTLCPLQAWGQPPNHPPALGTPGTWPRAHPEGRPHGSALVSPTHGGVALGAGHLSSPPCP